VFSAHPTEVTVCASGWVLNQHSMTPYSFSVPGATIYKNIK